MSHLYDLFVSFGASHQQRSPGVSWINACGALCSQFCADDQGWAKTPAAYGPTAADVANNSGWLNPNYAAAPIGAWHFFTLGADGHVGQDLNGGGTDVAMATDRAVKVRLAPYLGIQSVPGYVATGGNSYRGWATNYWGGITAYKEPVVVPTATQRQTSVNANRRTAPVVSNPTTANISAPAAPAGTIITMAGWITGGAVGTNSTWFKTSSGDYMWSGDFTNQATTSLTDLNPAPVVNYTVSFDTTGGTSVPSQTVVSGKTATAPATAPTLDHFTFAGWFASSAQGGTPFDFTTPITANTTLYAQWTQITHTVTFDTDPGSPVASLTVNDGATITVPENPTLLDNTFDGWFADETATTPYDFTVPITADTTIYAAWSEIVYTVSFNTGAGSAVDSQSVDDGSEAAIPDAPTLDGYTFTGWYTDQTATVPFDFTQPITADTVVYAGWLVIPVPTPPTPTPPTPTPPTPVVPGDKSWITALVAGIVAVGGVIIAFFAAH